MQLDVGAAVRCPPPQRAHAIQQLQRGGLQQGLLLGGTELLPTLQQTPRAQTLRWENITNTPEQEVGEHHQQLGAEVGQRGSASAAAFTSPFPCTLLQLLGRLHPVAPKLRQLSPTPPQPINSFPAALLFPLPPSPGITPKGLAKG